MKLVATGRSSRAACIVLAALLSGCTTLTAQSRPQLTGPGSSSTRTPVAPASARSSRPVDPVLDVVPWLNAPPPAYQPPAISTPPVPAADARPCSHTDVTALFEHGNGAGGHQVTYLRFRNVSDSTCLLQGYPRAVATEPGQMDVIATSGSFFDYGHAANMPPGGTSLLGLETDTYCAARPGGGNGGPPYHRIAVSLPGGGTVFLASRGADGFDVSCGLHLTRFFDPSYPRPEPVYPTAVLTVSLELPATAHPGATLAYLVELSNPTANRVRLDPCPGYVEAVSTAPPVKERHALNCAPVGGIDPHHTVRFAMRLVIPEGTSSGAVTIHWSLDSPGGIGLGKVVIAV